MSNVLSGGLRYTYKRNSDTNERTDSGTSTNADGAEEDGGDDDNGVAACVRAKKHAKMLMPMTARAGCTDDTTKPGGPFPIYTNSRSSAPGGCYS